MPGVFMVIAFGAIAAFVGGVLLLRKDAKPTESSTKASLPPSGTPTPKDDPKAQLEAVKRIRQVVQGVIQNFTLTTKKLKDDAQAYDISLERHKRTLQKLVTIDDLRELERSLLEQVNEIQSANDVYRKQLDEANEKVESQQEELERLQTAAAKDFLTGIPNRRTLDQRLEEMMQLAKRHGRVFSIIVFDIDHFKSINDTHGHQAGDRVLKAVSHIIDERRRTSDLLARYGGEEFVLALPETTAEPAVSLANEIRQKIEKSKFRFEDNVIEVTISAGVSQVLPETDSVSTLFERADGALYAAKEGGRNRVELAQG